MTGDSDKRCSFLLLQNEFFYRTKNNIYRRNSYWIISDRTDKSEFVERFPELSLFFKAYSPLDSEMICIFPYFCPYAESAREIREIFS